MLSSRRPFHESGLWRSCNTFGMSKHGSRSVLSLYSRPGFPLSIRRISTTASTRAHLIECSSIQGRHVGHSSCYAQRDGGIKLEHTGSYCWSGVVMVLYWFFNFDSLSNSRSLRLLSQFQLQTRNLLQAGRPLCYIYVGPGTSGSPLRS